MINDINSWETFNKIHLGMKIHTDNKYWTGVQCQTDKTATNRKTVDARWYDLTSNIIALARAKLFKIVNGIVRFHNGKGEKKMVDNKRAS